MCNNKTKKVISVSLGSSSGDFEREVEFDGVRVKLSREGTNGAVDLAEQRIKELDGNVDAIGIGGIDAFLYVGGEQFIIGDGKRLLNAASITPTVDGSGLKNTLERDVVNRLAEQGLAKQGTKVLMVSALDRFGMAEEFVKLRCDCVFGDLIFNIGLDFPLTKLSDIHDLAKKYRSRLQSVPFHMLYPTGAAQDAREADPRYAKYYDAADIIAGDSHLILRHLPEKLVGKGIVTNTTREKTIARFADAGVSWIMTTTPDLDGISGGTNLMEAVLVALIGKAPDLIKVSDLAAWAEMLGWHGSFHELSPHPS